MREMPVRNIYGWSVAAVLCLSAVARADGPASLDPDAAPALNATVPADFVPHTAGDSGVTVRAPKDWREAPGRNRNTKLVLLADHGRNVNLVVTSGVGLTLARVVTDIPPALAKQFKGFKAEQADLVKLADQPAARLVYTATMNGLPLKFCQFFLIKNGKQYILTYTARANVYADLLPQFESVAVSIKLP